MIKRLLITIVLTFTTLHIVNAIDDSNPYKLMNVILKNTFSRLKNEQLKIQSNPKHLLDIIDQELLPYIQTQYVGALVLGKYYKENITSSQLAAYFSIFQEYLRQIYAQTLAMYHGQEYKISPPQPIGNASVIPIRVTIFNANGRPPIRVDFQWYKNRKENNWRLYDIIIEGVSMVSSKRNEWDNLLHTKGIEGLTEKLQMIVESNRSKN